MEGTSDPDGEGPHQTQGPIDGGHHGGIGGGPGPQSSKRRLGPSTEVPGAKVRATARGGGGVDWRPKAGGSERAGA
jgi:hypothetical protein